MTHRLPRIELLRPELGLWGGIMLLLSTLFMSSATFAPPLPFVQLPASTYTGCHLMDNFSSNIGVSVGETGRIYLDFFDEQAQRRIVESVAKESGYRFGAVQWQELSHLPYIGLPVNELPAYLALPSSRRRHAALLGVPVAELPAYIRAAVKEGRRQEYWARHPHVFLRIDKHLSAERVNQILRVFRQNGIHRFYLVTELKPYNAPD
ncbi:biopolymer transport protein ExbD [Hymenobacter sp. UYP22]